MTLMRTLTSYLLSGTDVNLTYHTRLPLVEARGLTVKNIGNYSRWRDRRDSETEGDYVWAQS